MPRLHNTLKSLSSECAKMFQGINITPPCALVSSAKSLMSFLLKVMTEQDAKAMPAENDTKTLEVIYNSVCPVCEAGVCSFQKKVDPANGHYVWLDINTAPERLSKFNISLDDVRLKLHAIDRSGELRIGIEAVTAIFNEVPRYKWLAVLARLPVLNIAAKGLYNLTAHILYKWNRSKGRWSSLLCEISRHG